MTKISPVSVGRVAKAHGIRGEVLVRFQPGAVGVLTAKSLLMKTRIFTKDKEGSWSGRQGQGQRRRRRTFGSTSDSVAKGRDTEFLELEVERLRQRDASSAIVKFKRIDDRNRAEALAGITLYQWPDRLPEPEEDEFYIGDLMGLEVFSAEDGVRLGSVKGVLETGGHDSIVVTNGAYEFMIPFVDEFVLSVDLDRGVLEVRLPEGLLEATKTKVRQR